MNYAKIKNFDIANGEGVRVSLFVSGCSLKCEGCFNKEAQDFNYGKRFTSEVLDTILEMLSNKHIAGLSILGGEPFDKNNQIDVMNICEKVKKEYPHKDIWIWSGYTIENLLAGDQKINGVTEHILDIVDVLVDGPYKESKKDVSLQFRGSSNQRIWDLKNLTPYVTTSANVAERIILC